MGNLIKVHGIVNLRRDVESGIFYTVMRHESKLITRSLSTKSKTTARLRHANVMAAILAPPAQPTPTAQMSEVIERYKKFITAHPDLKPRSKRYRIETLNCIIKSWPEFSAVKAEEVTMADCEAWRDRLLFSGMSAPRFNGCLCTLRGIFRIAISMGAVRKILQLSSSPVG